jgi:hypothetical protein
MKQRRSPRQQGSHSPVHAAAPVVQDEGVWPAVDPELLAGLPPVMRGVIKALGYARGRSFLEQHGGAYISLPKTRATHTLGLLPDELVRLNITLAHHIPTTRLVTLPKADKLYLHFRNEQLMRDRNKMSLRATAKQHKLTTRQVLNIQSDFEEGRRSFAVPSANRMQFLLC